MGSVGPSGQGTERNWGAEQPSCAVKRPDAHTAKACASDSREDARHADGAPIADSHTDGGVVPAPACTPAKREGGVVGAVDASSATCEGANRKLCAVKEAEAFEPARAAAGASRSSRRGIWIQRGVIIAILAACGAAYCLVPPVRTTVDAVLGAFASGDFGQMRAFIASYGGWAAAISFLLMIAQSVAAPLPAFLLTIANANLFGWWQGAILSWTSAMAGAAVCFWIARVFGRDAVEKLATRGALAKIDEFFERHGDMSVLIARLLPFVSFDFVSYFAGLTGMSFGSFMLFTGIGQLPATIVYSYVGGMLTGGGKLLMTGLLILFALAALVVLVRQVYVERTR